MSCGADCFKNITEFYKEVHRVLSPGMFDAVQVWFS